LTQGLCQNADFWQSLCTSDAVADSPGTVAGFVRQGGRKIPCRWQDANGICNKLVIGKNGTFQINPDFNIHTDFDRFESACIQLKTEEKPDMRHSLYHSAIDLYKGQLLPRFEHELWLMQLSMYYQSLYLQITKGYVRLKMECKDYILAQKTAIDALRFDPKDSELNMYAILSMGFQGNLSMAQTYYTAAKPYLALEHAEVIKKYLNVK
jgi:two-component SAPR family response regulator